MVSHHQTSDEMFQTGAVILGVTEPQDECTRAGCLDERQLGYRPVDWASELDCLRTEGPCPLLGRLAGWSFDDSVKV